ncbi:hypothetical protein D3C77_390090 [compost metagenome]
MRHVGCLRKGHCHEDSSFLDTRQALGKLTRRLVLIEMITTLCKPFDTLRGRDTASSNHQKVIPKAFAATGVHGLSGKIETRDVLHLKVDFRTQQRPLRAFQLFLEEQVEGHVHEGRFVEMIGTIGQQGDTHLIAKYLRIQFADQLVG